MFDAKSILEGLVRGAGGGAGQPGRSGGGLADILAEVLRDRSQTGAQSPGSQPGGPSGDYGGLGDILGELARGGQSAPAPRTGKGSVPQTGETSGAGGGLADIVAEVQRRLTQGAPAGKAPKSATQPSGEPGSAPSEGSILDALSEVLRQATAGAREGTTKVGQSTGAKDAIGRAAGRSPEDIMAALKDFIQKNPLAAGAAAGGLGGLVLGTRAGRAIAGSAARVGALALIGGLAYKAFQNYQAGKPLIGESQPTQAAPKGSGFDPAAVSNEAAALYIRAMIAAAAADGRLDEGEQSRIVDNLKQGGVDAEAEEFLASELNRPATVRELAAAVTSPEEALQVYTSARIAIEPDDAAESKFLQELAKALKIDPKLAAHVEASVKGAAA